MKDRIHVVIDPGHGNHDWGLKTTAGYHKGVNGIMEKDIVLEVSNRLAWYLAQHDISYAMTRYGDRFIELIDRTSFANKVKASLFLSLHCNYANDSRIKGMEVWHWRDSIFGKRYAEVFNAGLERLNYTRNRGLKTDDPETVKREDNYWVLKKTDMPSVIIELGFLSNPDDCDKLNNPNMQMIIAENLKETIKGLYLDKF